MYVQVRDNEKGKIFLLSFSRENNLARVWGEGLLREAAKKKFFFSGHDH